MMLSALLHCCHQFVRCLYYESRPVVVTQIDLLQLLLIFICSMKCRPFSWCTVQHTADVYNGKGPALCIRMIA